MRVMNDINLKSQSKLTSVRHSRGAGEPISGTGTIRPLNFSSMARSPVARGEQRCFRDKSLCAGKFVMFGQRSGPRKATPERLAGVIVPPA